MQETFEQKLDRAGAHFFAASIVLSERARATNGELETATNNQEATAKFLINNQYLPSKAFFKELPDGPDRHLAILAGQDGCIPQIDEINCWVVPGPRIQEVLSGIYPSWFHNLKRRWLQRQLASLLGWVPLLNRGQPSPMARTGSAAGLVRHI